MFQRLHHVSPIFAYQFLFVKINNDNNNNNNISSASKKISTVTFRYSEKQLLWKAGKMFYKKGVQLRPKACNFFKKRLRNGCFPMNIVKFLRPSFYIDQLWWLLLDSHDSAPFLVLHTCKDTEERPQDACFAAKSLNVWNSFFTDNT